jgi:hypothetical protein
MPLIPLWVFKSGPNRATPIIHDHQTDCFLAGTEIQTLALRSPIFVEGRLGRGKLRLLIPFVGFMHQGL